jgi:hypothetical protein
MNLDPKRKEEIEKIILGFQCPKDFKCYKTGFENLCKAKDGGLEDYLVCLEKNSKSCPFVLTFGFGYFCTCPLRCYIAKKLNK